MTEIQEIGFGGGCHWCTEAVFQNLKGVGHVQQGWIASTGTNEAFSEAVLVNFNTQQINLQTLIEIHLHTHKSTSNHSMRKKYRSAVYTFTEAQKKMVEGLIKKLQTDFDQPIITQVLSFEAFKSSEEGVKNYYIKNPKKPFCTTFIVPKLKIVLNKFSQYSKGLKDESFITKPLVDKKSKM